METMAVAYGLVWLAVVLFVTRMAMRQRKLERSFESLQASQQDDERQTRAA